MTDICSIQGLNAENKATFAHIRGLTAPLFRNSSQIEKKKATFAFYKHLIKNYSPIFFINRYFLLIACCLIISGLISFQAGFFVCQIFLVEWRLLYCLDVCFILVQRSLSVDYLSIRCVKISLSYWRHKPSGGLGRSPNKGDLQA